MTTGRKPSDPLGSRRSVTKRVTTRAPRRGVPQNIRRSLALHLNGLLAGFLLVVVGAIVIDAQVAAERAQRAEQAGPLPGSPEQLVAEHDCWTGEAPADMQGVIPGHVVVTTRSGVTRYAGPRMVGLALEQIFDGADHGLRVHAFCR